MMMMMMKKEKISVTTGKKLNREGDGWEGQNELEEEVDGCVCEKWKSKKLRAFLKGPEDEPRPARKVRASGVSPETLV
ncbi:hypothetical protein RUM43_007170, partial [Polyplax serrata]